MLKKNVNGANNSAINKAKPATLKGTYTFNGTSLVLTFDGDTTGVNVNFSKNMISFTYKENTCTLYRNVKYTVSFNTSGGSSVESESVQNGQKATKPSDPTKEGFTFIGWYKDSGFNTSFDFNNDIVTSDMTLYARYNVEIRVIPYSNSEEETNGGRAKFASHQAYPVSGDMKTGDEGKKETIQAKAEQHYEFAGWTVDDPEGEIISTDSKYTFVIDGAHTYYAVFHMTDHIWGEWDYTIEPTATTSGIRTRTCKLNPNHTETEIAPEIGGGDDGLGPQNDNKEEVKPTDTSDPDNAGDIIAKNDSPATGDNLYPAAWICLFSVSIILGGLMIACIARRKE